MLSPPLELAALTGVNTPIVDARHLRCPLPVLRLARALKELRPTVSIILCATDAAVLTDVPAYCAVQNVSVLGQVSVAGQHWFALRWVKQLIN